MFCVVEFGCIGFWVWEVVFGVGVKVGWDGVRWICVGNFWVVGVWVWLVCVVGVLKFLFDGVDWCCVCCVFVMCVICIWFRIVILCFVYGCNELNDIYFFV